MPLSDKTSRGGVCVWVVESEREGCVCMVCVWGDQNELAIQKQEVQYIQKNNVGYVVWCYVVCYVCGAVQCHVVWSISTLSFSHPASQPSVWVGRQAEEHWIGLDTHHGMGRDGKEKWTTLGRKKKKKERKRGREKKEREREGGKRKRGGRSRHPLLTGNARD